MFYRQRCWHGNYIRFNQTHFHWCRMCFADKILIIHVEAFRMHTGLLQFTHLHNQILFLSLFFVFVSVLLFIFLSLSLCFTCTFAAAFLVCIKRFQHPLYRCPIIYVARYYIHIHPESTTLMAASFILLSVF